VKQNPTEAARWFEKAARQGDPEAALVLASLYGSGRGIDQDRQAAYFWYTLAADWGKAEASEQRLMLAREMTPGEMGEVLEKLANWRNQTAEGPEPEGAIPADPGKPR
jgi:TPR repeat protein